MGLDPVTSCIRFSNVVSIRIKTEAEGNEMNFWANQHKWKLKFQAENVLLQ